MTDDELRRGTSLQSSIHGITRQMRAAREAPSYLEIALYSITDADFEQLREAYLAALSRKLGERKAEFAALGEMRVQSRPE